MTTTPNLDDATPDEIIAAGLSAAERVREQIAAIEQARDTQPERLAQARANAETARDWACIEEPWQENVTALRAYTADGTPTATSIALPNIIAKELYRARLAFDMLDAGDDDDQRDEIRARYFMMVDGDSGLAFLLFAAALDIIAGHVVPQMLDNLEQTASDYDTRALLAEARVKTWRDRVAYHRGPQG